MFHPGKNTTKTASSSLEADSMNWLMKKPKKSSTWKPMLYTGWVHGEFVYKGCK